MSLQTDERPRGTGHETLVDHLVFMAAYVATYVAFVALQSMHFNAHGLGKDGGTLFLMFFCAIPFFIGFVPMWFLSRYACAGKPGWFRHGVLGFISGAGALGLFYAMIALGLFG